MIHPMRKLLEGYAQQGTSLLRSCVHVFEALGVTLEGNGHSENGT